jgi:hypothetical protein
VKVNDPMYVNQRILLYGMDAIIRQNTVGVDHVLRVELRPNDVFTGLGLLSDPSRRLVANIKTLEQEDKTLAPCVMVWWKRPELAEGTTPGLAIARLGIGTKTDRLVIHRPGDEDSTLFVPLPEEMR